MSNRTGFFLSLAMAGLNALAGIRTGSGFSWFLTGALLATATTSLGLWLRDRDEARQDAQGARADDRAPRTVATWTCPDCGDDIPLSIHPDHTLTVHPGGLIIIRLDRTDIHAHQLTHEGA